MKALYLAPFCLMFTVELSLAQPAGFDFADMQKKAEEAERCMSEISEDDMRQLERDAKALESKISELCSAGKRAQAQTEALEMANKLRTDETILLIRECTEKLTGMMAGIMPSPPAAEDFESDDGSHICD